MWLDGVVGAMCLAALAAIFAFQPVSDTGDAPALLFAYPAGDLVVIAVLVVMTAADGWRLTSPWLLMAVGFAAIAVGDGAYILRAADGTWSPGTILDLPYAAGAALIALAAWRRPARTRADPGMRRLGVPIVFAVVAVGLHIYEDSGDVATPARVLVSATLLAIVARLWIAFADDAALLRVSRQEALTDAVTGLGNRRKLLRDLSRDPPSPACPRLVAIFDLDGFKHDNDAYGHAAGDALLARLGARLHDAVAARGAAYRMGGDEFAVVLRCREDERDALLAQCAAALTEDGEGFRIESSWGGAMMPSEALGAGSALRLADRRMYARKNARPASASSQTRDVLVRVLAEREPDLHDHVLDVGALALAVGQRLGMPDDALGELVHGAELHDVGKIAIPEAILRKPGPLTDEEREFMRRHTIIGERFLLGVPTLRSVGRLVRASHEAWDGSGYPDGLAGEAIPLGARVIAACDAYDAIVTDRPYRRARTSEEALAELRRCAGSQFDPRVVEALCAVIEEGALTPASRATAR